MAPFWFTQLKGPALSILPMEELVCIWNVLNGHIRSVILKGLAKPDGDIAQEQRFG